MTSPFERVSNDLASAIRDLEPEAQVVLFAAAGRALAARYLAWEEANSLPSQTELLDRAIDHSIAYALGERASIDSSLLLDVENATPSQPSDVAGFTAAQDCWIAVDTSLRSGLGEFDAADGAWYLVEPIFQATSERLFGVSDPGSEHQDEAETAALRDASLAAAIDALTESIATLQGGALTRRTFEQFTARLGAIAP